MNDALQNDMSNLQNKINFLEKENLQNQNINTDQYNAYLTLQEDNSKLIEDINNKKINEKKYNETYNQFPYSYNEVVF